MMVRTVCATVLIRAILSKLHRIVNCLCLNVNVIKVWPLNYGYDGLGKLFLLWDVWKMIYVIFPSSHSFMHSFHSLLTWPSFPTRIICQRYSTSSHRRRWVVGRFGSLFDLRRINNPLLENSICEPEWVFETCWTYLLRSVLFPIDDEDEELLRPMIGTPPAVRHLRTSSPVPGNVYCNTGSLIKYDRMRKHF